MTQKLLEEIKALLVQRDEARDLLHPKQSGFGPVKHPSWNEQKALMVVIEDLTLKINLRLKMLAEVAEASNDVLLNYEQYKLTQHELDALVFASGFMLGHKYPQVSETLAGLANRMKKKTP